MARDPRTPPFSLRLTFEERQKLEELASGDALGAYIKSVVFNEAAKLPPDRSSPERRQATLRSGAVIRPPVASELTLITLRGIDTNDPRVCRY